MPGRLKLLVAALETSVSCILTGSQVIQGDKLCGTLWRHWKQPGEMQLGAPRTRPQRTQQTQEQWENDPWRAEWSLGTAALHQNKAGSKGEHSSYITCRWKFSSGQEWFLSSGRHSNVKTLQHSEHKPWSPIFALLPHYTSFTQHSWQDLDSILHMEHLYYHRQAKASNTAL